MALGDVIGVRGTSTIVRGDGRILPGYLPAAELEKVVERVGSGATGG